MIKVKTKIFLILFILFFTLNKIVFSIDFKTANEYLKNKDYSKSYDAFNKCTSECLEFGNCNKEHFLCMLEIGRMLEKGIEEKDLTSEQKSNLKGSNFQKDIILSTKEQRKKKAKFWYKYCSDKGSEVCAEKLSTLNPRNKVIVQKVQEKLFDLGYPIMRDDISGTETFSAIKQFQRNEGLPLEFPIEQEEWLNLNDMLASAIANKENNKYEINIGKPTDYATGIWVGEKNKLYVLTAGHFANGCQKIRSNKLGLRIFQIDNRNDLALLESNDQNNDKYLPARFPSEGIHENDKIYVFGYPRQTIIGKSETSEGEIVSLSLKPSGGDRSKIIIKADLHLHSSGSPVINDKGLIVGTVHAKASIWKVIKERLNLGVTSIGHNIATSIYTIRSFLDENNIKYSTYNSKKKDREKIISEAKRYTIALECWGKKN